MRVARALRRLARFRRSRRGAASVEAMLVFPLLFWVYAGSFVYFEAFRSYNVTVKASYTIGDILSRWTHVNETDMQGMNSLLRYLVQMPEGDTALRVSSVEFFDETYTVTWSWASTPGNELTNQRLNTLTDYLPVMHEGDTVIVTETIVPFRPGMRVGLQDRDWRNVVVTRPRFAGQLAWTGN